MDKQTLILKTQIELSTQRVRVLKAFENANILQPKEIAALTDMNFNPVSRTLGQLKQMELVTVVCSKGRARYYSLTNKGKYIIDFIDDLDE